MVLLIFWAALGYLMDWPSFRIIRWVCLGSIGLYFLTGILKNLAERKEFQRFLEEQREDRDVQEKLQKERSVRAGSGGGKGLTGGKRGVESAFKDKKTGIDWMPANVHGSVPARKKRRSFLSKNR